MRATLSRAPLSTETRQHCVDDTCREPECALAKSANCAHRCGWFTGGVIGNSTPQAAPGVCPDCVGPTKDRVWTIRG